MLRAYALKYRKSWDKCLPYNFHITIVIKLVSKWHCLRHSMDDNVEHHCSRVRLESVMYLV
jgi:hypothetical protein